MSYAYLSKNQELKDVENIIGKSPMTRQELGRHGWSVLHMIAATYPEEADREFVLQTNEFLNLL